MPVMQFVLIFLIWSKLFVQQSGFEGFIRDKYTILPETRERMLATEVTASWMYVIPERLAHPVCLISNSLLLQFVLEFVS